MISVNAMESILNCLYNSSALHFLIYTCSHYEVEDGLSEADEDAINKNKQQ